MNTLADAAEVESVSLGSMVELGWADLLNKVVIVVLDPHRARDPHNHPFVREIATYLVGSLEEAVVVILTLAGATLARLATAPPA